MEPFTYTHESTITLDIPNLGTVTIRAGVDFYNVHVDHVVIFGKTYYNDDVTVSADGTSIDISRFSRFTDAAKRRLVDVLSSWAPSWTASADARALLAATVTYHNEINARMVRDEITRATNHLRELEMLAERYRAIDEPTEYVSPYSTTYRLTDN